MSNQPKRKRSGHHSTKLPMKVAAQAAAIGGLFASLPAQRYPAKTCSACHRAIQAGQGYREVQGQFIHTDCAKEKAAQASPPNGDGSGQ